MTTYEMAQQICDEYDPENMGRKTLTIEGDEWRLELASGGWSENEEWISRARVRGRSKRSRALWLWWVQTWQSSHRGGLHVFGGPLNQPFCGDFE